MRSRGACTKQRVQRQPLGAADQIVSAISIAALAPLLPASLRVHPPRRQNRRPNAEQAGRHMGHRRHHAGDGFAGHGARRGSFGPADTTVVGFDARRTSLSARSAGHFHRLFHRRADRDRLDGFESPRFPSKSQCSAAARRPAKCTGLGHMATSGGVRKPPRQMRHFRARTCVPFCRALARHSLPQPQTHCSHVAIPLRVRPCCRCRQWKLTSTNSIVSVLSAFQVHGFHGVLGP